MSLPKDSPLSSETVPIMRPPSCARGTSSRSLTPALLLVLLFHHLARIRGHMDDSALTVVENSEGGQEGGPNEEEALVVQPTEQWQTLKPGQTVPVGSYVRLNLQTGQREVRLGEEQLKYWTQEHREEAESFFSPAELKEAMKKIKEDMKHLSKDTGQQDVLSSRHRLEELKREMDQMDLLVETDVQIMRRLLEQFNSSNTNAEQRLNILLELEYMVHQVDNAQTLCSMGGLQLVLAGLNSSDVRLQENSAFVLGAALSSNPVVQVKALEVGTLHTLLTVLATAQPLKVKKKVLFAVASLLRHFPYAQQNFLSHGGLQVLSELFRADGAGVLQIRIVTMLYDMISEKELISQTGFDQVLDASYKERVRQYSKVSLDGDLMETGWCSLVPQLLESTEHDYREKALQALLAMASMCLDQYRSDSSLQDSLLSLRDQYKDLFQSEMIQGEERDYYREIAKLIDALQVRMKTAWPED